MVIQLCHHNLLPSMCSLLIWKAISSYSKTPYLFASIFFYFLFCPIDSSIWCMKNDSCSRPTLFKLLRFYVLKHRRDGSLSLVFLSIFCLFTFPYHFLNHFIELQIISFYFLRRVFICMVLSPSIWEYYFPLYWLKSSWTDGTSVSCQNSPSPGSSVLFGLFVPCFWDAPGCPSLRSVIHVLSIISHYFSSNG